MDMLKIQKMVDDGGIVFLSYGGFLSQTLIAGMTEALEKETESNNLSMSISSNLFTIFIELSQNMMNYSKTKEANDNSLQAEGLILVSRDKKNYYVHSQNIVSAEDKEKIEPKLKEIQTLSKSEIKKRYRELRKSGKHTHDKGGGIGFYEIAKRCDALEYDFQQINEDKYYFHIKTVTIHEKEGE